MVIRKARWLYLLLIVLAQGMGVGQGRELGLLKMSLPEKNWALEMNLVGFQIVGSDLSDEFKSRALQVSNKNAGLIISAFLAPAHDKWTSVMYRDDTWKALSKKFKYEQVRTYERDGWAFVEGLAKDVGDVKNINQFNIFGYLTREDAWVNIHISKLLFKPEDEAVLQPVLDSIRIVDYQQSSTNYLFYATLAYTRKQYPLAIKYYEIALEMDKTKPELPKEPWHVLVDNLTMAYGISGNLQKSRATAEYGLTKDPEYPLFHYNLACTSAEEGDLESALGHLETAYKYKANMIKGEKFPDPAKDSSFKKFLKDKRFKEFLKAHK